MMRKSVLIASLSIFCLSCELDKELQPVGGQSCVVVDSNIILGEEAEKITCHTGLNQFKKQDGQYVEECVGFKLPTNEICNLIDDDCNGKIDEIVFQPLDSNNPCNQETYGVCKHSTYECINGKMLCNRPKWAGPPVERCDQDLLDEDCDNLINEEDPSLILSGPEWQYDGPFGTENRGQCRAGHKECINGKETVFGMILPEKEVCSDNIDNDCDEKIDENEIIREKTDFLVIFDTTTSMAPFPNIYEDIFCQWANQSIYVNSRFAIALIGIRDAQHYITPLTDFTDAQNACIVIADFDGYGYAAEYPFDTIFHSFLSENDLYKMEWSPYQEIESYIYDSQQVFTYLKKIPREVIIVSDFSYSTNSSYQIRSEPNNIWSTNLVDYTIEFAEIYDLSINIFMPDSYQDIETPILEEITNSCGGILERGLSLDVQESVNILSFYFGSETC